DARNIFVEAFENGEKAAIKMGQTVEDVLENILSQLIFNKVFADTFEQLEKDMAKSMDIGGDQDWTDDFARFLEGMQTREEAFNDWMKEAQKQGNRYGFDLFQPEKEDLPKGLQGAIRREMTEEMASELTGLFRAYYDLQKVNNNTAFEHLKVGKQQADALLKIEVNTFNTVGRLDGVITRLDGMSIRLDAVAKNTAPINNMRAYNP